MASQGPNSFGTSANAGTGGTSWTTGSPFNCTCSLGDTSSSDTLLLTNCGFSLLAGSVPVGIQASFTRSETTFNAAINDTSIKLVIGGVVAGNNKSTSSTWTTSPVGVNYGANNDLWGTSPAFSDVNASNFGLGIGIFASPADTGTVSAGDMTITYTGGSSPSPLAAMLGIPNKLVSPLGIGNKLLKVILDRLYGELVTSKKEFEIWLRTGIGNPIFQQTRTPRCINGFQKQRWLQRPWQ